MDAATQLSVLIRKERNIPENYISIPEWQAAFLKDWSIVGMNHYHVKGEKLLFVAMTNGNKCITAEGKDDEKIWEQLNKKAIEKDNEYT